uniref:Uncharacterized protein n=1 Tax=viral metagenome TaxID=1070528 RepID=A0A6C0HQ49_9ZZZZ
MNNSPNTYSAPLRPLTPTYTPTTTYGTTTGTGSTFLGMSVTTWIIIVLVLAILGFNIFAYLAYGTKYFSDTFGPYIKYLGGLIGNATASVTKSVTNTAATGTKAAVDLAAGTVTTAVDVTQQTAGAITGATASSSLTGSQKTNSNAPVSSQDTTPNNPLNDALKNAKPQGQQSGPGPFAADDATSAIQSNKSSSKSGWCYIGQEQGYRSCLQVGENDTCMSGNIFPSQEICVNPNLRA